MELSEKVEQQITSIQNHIDPASQYYGRLLNWQDGVWHYGIGLSDADIFDTGRGMQVFKRSHVAAKFVKDIPVYSRDIVIERLIQALQYFMAWDYGLLGWNCEHLARLIATNDPISYEVRKTPLRYLNSDGYHPTAKQDFEQYLQIHAPHLLKIARDEEIHSLE